MIAKTMMEAFKSGKMELWEKIKLLSFAKPSQIPQEWKIDYQMVASALLHHPDNFAC